MLSPVHFTARATIITPPEDLVVAVGENATFTCVASGNSPPDIQWFQTNNSGLIFLDSESETSLNITVSSTLLISNVMENDFGSYFCMARNEFSTARANFTLFQAGELSWSYCITVYNHLSIISFRTTKCTSYH